MGISENKILTGIIALGVASMLYTQREDKQRLELPNECSKIKSLEAIGFGLAWGLNCEDKEGDHLYFIRSRLLQGEWTKYNLEIKNE